MVVRPIIFGVLVCCALQAQPFERAAELFWKGDLAQAEQILRAALREQDRDARVPMLLGVVLDQQKRFREAEPLYQSALRLEPRSPVILNNLGNHYLASGQPEKARTVFLNVIAIEPPHVNANLQLAQLAASRRDGAEVLKYLDHMPASSQDDVSVQLLRARALYWTAQPETADAVLAKIQQLSSMDARVSFSVGMAYADGKRYQSAEKAFSRALESAGPNFTILYNLGLAAANTGNLERARAVLEIALQEQPGDADALYVLARVHAASGRRDIALGLLVRAHRTAPGRADIVEFLARDSDALGFFGDAAQAYTEYLKLRPNDDLIRRDRALALIRANRAGEAVSDLESYVAKHPQDHLGFLYLAAAETYRNPDRALAHVNRALRIRAGDIHSLYTRGALLYQRSKFAEAARDFHGILEQQPDSVRALDRLGQCYLQLDRPQEAVNLLRKASGLAPADPKVLFHYSQALRGAGCAGQRHVRAPQRAERQAHARALE